MCGIAGWFQGSQKETPDRSVLERMAQTIEHRGPDDSGFLTRPGIGFAFRRLSIVDIDGGHQPLANRDESVFLIFNGELYNHLQIRQQLTAKGYEYSTQSDAETVLHAYSEWGEDCLSRFNGMFGFAIYDAAKHKLFLARDRMGIKPLHYAEAGGGLVFGSEIKSLLTHPQVSRQTDREAAALYLTYRYLPSPHTLFEGTKKLPPGHYLTADKNGIQVRPWWNVDFTRPTPKSFETAKDELESLLTHSVQDRLMADVPLGALLSGGVDSSIIVALMSKLHPGPVKTYSIGFSGSRGNEAELPFAKTVAQTLGTHHHELMMRESDLPAYIAPLIWNMDEPLVEPAAIPVYLVSRLAKESVTVVLTGEGADELFAGYPKYAHDRWARGYSRLPRTLREGLVRQGLNALPAQLRRVRVAERSLSISDEAERFASWFAGFAGPGRSSVLDSDLHRSLTDPQARGPVAQCLEDLNGADDLTRMLYADVKTWLADDLLMKMDRMSMATSIEARVPFLDHRLVDFAFSLPSEWKIKNGQGKYILRETLGRQIPQSILDRPKAGFPMPIHRWFREELSGFVKETLLSEKALSRGITNGDEVRRIIQNHVSGRRDFRRELWTLLNLELWHQIFVDAPSPPVTPPAVPSF